MTRKNFILNIFLTLTSVSILAGCAKDESLAPQEEHFEAIGMYFTSSGIRVASILRGETSDTLNAPLGKIGEGIEIQFYDKDENLIDPPEREHQKLAWEIEDPSIVEVWQHPGEEGGFEFHLKGLTIGITKIEFFIMHEEHADFRSGKIPVKVE